MAESFEMSRYLDHLGRRWRVIALACGVAVGLALVTCLLIPNRYTATARVMIDPPAGSDPRVAVAISPVYLESLKTYELLASGDRLFLDALDHFKLARSKSIDALKRSVMKVRLARNTRVLEISATLPDARQAQALALYIANATVKLTRDVSLSGDDRLIADAQKQWDDARARVEKAEIAWARLSSQSMDRSTARAGEVATVQAEREAARDALEAATKHLGEVRGFAGYRAEQLSVIDPGIVPERPSWPNIPLIVIAALVVALAASLLYVTFEFNYRLERSAVPRPVAPLARVKGLND